jgi:hypothetical protein
MRAVHASTAIFSFVGAAAAGFNGGTGHAAAWRTQERDMHNPTPRLSRIELGHGELLAFDAVPGERVRLLFGAAWLTQEGQADDSFLCPGDELCLRGGRVLVAASGHTAMRRSAEARPWRLRRWPRPLHALRRWVTRLQLGPWQPEPAA